MPITQVTVQCVKWPMSRQQSHGGWVDATDFGCRTIVAASSTNGLNSAKQCETSHPQLTFGGIHVDEQPPAGDPEVSGDDAAEFFAAIQRHEPVPPQYSQQMA